MNLAILFFQGAPSKEKLRKIVKEYPHLTSIKDQNTGGIIMNFIK